ncbi:hypothetical protein [Paractinoplanes atraurantiacus]|uniref:Uncharacterized protein n=1 Tax=Paractinoplanes atraurantiacus TaxID=1036182 RepID=A0A285GPL7_9ACTN|nr:hypothetical protein [Actinoplanes atraurantiacus]SNY25512.1 hypothetical protein SAMN05421748_102354 [Actinoplanes atraurantiacus]
MRIPLPHLVVGGLSVVAAGLVTLTLWLVVLGAAGLTASVIGALPSGRRSPHPADRAGTRSGTGLKPRI